jgi:hypothetical protein
VLREPADFGGQCLAGACVFDASLLLPSSSFLGLPKAASYLYGTWRDDEGNLLRALRGVRSDSSTFRFLFVSRPGHQIERHEAADRDLFAGPIAIEESGSAVTFSSAGTSSAAEFDYRHEVDRCSWSEGAFLDVSGSLIGPGLQWFNPWPGGGCFYSAVVSRVSPVTRSTIFRLGSAGWRVPTSRVGRSASSRSRTSMKMARSSRPPLHAATMAGASRCCTTRRACSTVRPT